MTTRPASEATRNFRLRFLLNPFYVWRQARSLSSPGDFRRRVADLGRYLSFLIFDFRSGISGIVGNYFPTRGELCRPSDPTRSPAQVVRLDVREGGKALNGELDRRSRELSAVFRAATPFRHIVLDGFLDPALCRRLVAEFPAYDRERFRNEHGHLGKAHHEKVSELGPAFRELDALARSGEFLRLMGEITGIPGLLHDPRYAGGGTHENLEGMELDPHVDFTVHPESGLYRRVNLLLYLNPEWEESWGGALELHVDPWKPRDQDPVRTISPLFNRCVLFETSDRSWHGFQAIRLPEGRKGLSRRSFALYLYTREDPRGIPAIPADLTVFVDRPLPPEFKAGRTLSVEDVRVLQHLIVRRDWKLKYLYGRAISLYNQWKAGEARRAND